jgi:hypothetical protein
MKQPITFKLPLPTLHTFSAPSCAPTASYFARFSLDTVHILKGSGLNLDCPSSILRFIVVLCLSSVRHSISAPRWPGPSPSISFSIHSFGIIQAELLKLPQTSTIHYTTLHYTTIQYNTIQYNSNCAVQVTQPTIPNLLNFSRCKDCYTLLYHGQEPCFRAGSA